MEFISHWPTGTPLEKICFFRNHMQNSFFVKGGTLMRTSQLSVLDPNWLEPLQVLKRKHQQKPYISTKMRVSEHQAPALHSSQTLQSRTSLSHFQRMLGCKNHLSAPKNMQGKSSLAYLDMFLFYL